MKKSWVKILLIVCLLVLTAIVAYSLGRNHQASQSKTQSSSTFLEQLKKNASQVKKQTTTSITSTTSSGAYRLYGTVQQVAKDSIILKLASGGTIILTTKETTPYYQAGTRYTVAELQKNAIVIATGTIADNGTFTVSALQQASQ